MTLTAYSTALYSSWMFVEDLRLLFDAGDGVSAHLLGKSRKAQRVALTHADRDHITGLVQLQQLNARPGNRLEVLYPADSRGIGLLAEFYRNLDPWSGPYVDWRPVRPEEDAAPERLVLNHFSSRYSESEIHNAVHLEARDLKIDFPIYVVPPGRVVNDILSTVPVWR